MTQPQQDFESLLDYLKRSRGFDFTGYKRGSLERRVTKRMQSVEVASFADYLDYLEVHPEDADAAELLSQLERDRPLLEPVPDVR